MFENPLVFSLFLSTIISVGYIMYNKKASKKENSKKNINTILIFAIVFISSLILNICVSGEKHSKKVTSGGGYSNYASEYIKEGGGDSNRLIPPF